MLIVGAIVVLIVLGGIFYFKKDIAKIVPTSKNQQSNQSINTFDTANVSCPLLPNDCRHAVIYTTKIKNFNFNQIGFYNVASATPVLAVFDGVFEKDSLQFFNEKRASITNGNYVAEYRFIGQFPTKLTEGVIKKGTVIGTSDQRLSYFDKKYNFIFSIWDKKTNRPIDIKFKGENESIEIVK